MSRKAASMQGFADNFIPVIPVEDDALHTDEHPFCFVDPTCYCREDEEAITTVNQAVQEGPLTPEEATDFVLGKLL